MDELRLRRNNYNMNDRNILKTQTCMWQHLFDHFTNEGHCSFLENVTITFINKTDPIDPNRREHYWMHTVKEMAPLGLEVKDYLVVSAVFYKKRNSGGFWAYSFGTRLK